MSVRLAGLRKSFGSAVAVHGMTLDVESGSFLTFLGPSGCGKTTTLRMIGGFERADAGDVIVDGDVVTGLPPFRRDVSTVFQDYALFPHMTVLRNVEYGLRFRGVGRRERHTRAMEMLERVGLEAHARKHPAHLSGGQRQRVALARALITEPKALLLDEPLSALDARLRRELQLELKHLQEESGTTFIYVTHDQEEALVMSDRIAVMNGGRIEQLGTPEEIYNEPATLFVARFIGQCNFLSGRASTTAGDRTVELAGGETLHVGGTASAATGDAVTVAIRPEAVEIVGEETASADAANTVKVRMLEVIFSGNVYKLHTRVSSGELLEIEKGQGAVSGDVIAAPPGTELTVRLPADSIRVFPGEGDITANPGAASRSSAHA